MANITEDYVSFETAKLLKEKSFNEPCYTCYLNKELSYYDYLSTNFELIDNAYSAPTLQMAMKWLREEYRISIEISALNCYYCTYTIYRLLEEKVKEVYNDGTYSSYEDATNDALKYCLEHLI